VNVSEQCAAFEAFKQLKNVRRHEKKVIHTLA
jgi:hypothetical protein